MMPLLKKMKMKLVIHRFHLHFTSPSSYLGKKSATTSIEPVMDMEMKCLFTVPIIQTYLVLECSFMSGIGSMCSQQSKYLVSYSSGALRNNSSNDTSWHQLSLMKHHSIASGLIT